MKKYVLILLMALFALPTYGQKHIEKQLKGYTNPDELVTLSETIAFDKAIVILSQVSENLTGKKILSTADFTDPIGMISDFIVLIKFIVIKIFIELSSYMPAGDA